MTLSRSSHPFLLPALALGVALLTGCGTGSAAGSQDSAAVAVATASDAEPASGAPGWPPAGSYGCTETIPRLRDGSYEFDFEPRGLVVIEAGGAYTDPFGVKGSYRTLASGDSAVFGGALLDRATATPIEDEPDRIRIEIPTGSGSRKWTCGRKEGE